ncbi:transporter substrate-binding domain-containing protein, partial [Acinetobacter baumannii]
PIPAAVQAIPKDFKFVKPGFLSVAITPFSPPIATYATDARTVVGFDPDYAQLIADSLDLKLDLVAIAWPDWPLGLTSGKYDAVISN